MVFSPSKRPMPWSTWTTRSPGVSAATSVRKSCGRLRLALRAHEAVAENVLLADDGEIAGLEARFQPQTRDRDLVFADRPAHRRSARPAWSGAGRDRAARGRAARASLPTRRRGSRASLAACRSRMWRITRFEDVGALLRPLGDEVAALRRASQSMTMPARRSRGSRRASAARAGSSAVRSRPFLRPEIERVRRQRPIGRDAGLRSAPCASWRAS